jgi:serine protease Do
MKTLLFTFVGFFFIVSIASAQAVKTAPAADGKVGILRTLSDEFAKAAEKIKPSVVSVRTTSEVALVDPYEYFYGPRYRRRSPKEEEVPLGMGSGIVVNNGYVLTNNHVIKGASRIYVKLSDGRQIEGHVVGTDPNADVAVVKLSSGERLVSAELGDSDSMRVGDWVLAVGNPLGLEQTVTAGIISAKGRSDMNIAHYEDFIQTDAAINPGNSGGPLVDLDGKVIGMNTAIASQTGGYQGMGFAIPINMARVIMESLIKDGKVNRGYLGVQMQEINPKLSKMLGLKETQGVLVVQVEPDSPALSAGLQRNDVVTRFNGKPIDSVRRLMSLIKTSLAGQVVELTVIRDGQEKVLKVKLANETPQAAAVESLGIEVANVDTATAERYGYRKSTGGVVITRVDPAGRAAVAGLSEGDLIMAINKQKVADLKAYSELIGKVGDGDVMLLVVHQGRYFYVPLPGK